LRFSFDNNSIGVDAHRRLYGFAGIYTFTGRWAPTAGEARKIGKKGR
tara:strand:- start:452 stop:592 length:141 start_codon:yes stop_codon:yes gene_type:complete